VHKVSSKAESEAPAVARWAALVGYAKRTVLRRRLKVSAVEEDRRITDVLSRRSKARFPLPKLTARVDG